MSSTLTTLDELEFPKAVLTRLLKSSLPENIAIQKEARQAITKASTVFVSYLAATANDCARESGHKTIMSNDIFKALEAVGLGDFVDRLQGDLVLHAEVLREKKERKSKEVVGGNEEEEGEEAEEEEEDEVEDAAEALETEETMGEAEFVGAAGVSVVKEADGTQMDVDDVAKRPRIE
ncbi:histone-fold-containing protein [Kickxella alabastrina]|uniref:histone-fold-containing protein n=1 Tax=Kickxella alabastrina TaxID=61397 RepID=UPI00222010B4|nr:histone-fold-containing protein [Kickxella alabastrina]KAI7825032.1 histone-fold-containing protein [Kickxella alabastrina]